MATSASVHADRRYRYMRGLWSKASSASVANYREKEFQHLCKALARISVAAQHLPDRHSVINTVRGCGDGIEELLHEFDDAAGDNRAPRRGQYCGAAAALLVALLEETERAEGIDPHAAEAGVMGKLNLLQAAAGICEQPFLSRQLYEAAAAVGAKEPRCAAAQQLASLCTLQFVKEMQRKKLCVTHEAFRLTDEGRRRAAELRAAGEAAAAGPRHSHLRIQPGERLAVLLLVDEREGGGAQHHLSEIASALRRHGCRFETRVLPQGLGDYQFVIADGGVGGATGAGVARERVVPRIIERKSAPDVGASLKDGRWAKQQAAMRRARDERFGGAASLEYIIEGELKDALHPTCHACQGCPHRGVGGCPAQGYPSIEVVDAELRALEARGYIVTRTASLLATAAHLANERARLQQHAGLGAPSRAPTATLTSS